MSAVILQTAAQLYKESHLKKNLQWVNAFESCSSEMVESIGHNYITAY